MTDSGHHGIAPFRASIIISTDGRAESLAVTLDSLRYQRYQPFEVIVVTGPTPDSTQDVLARWHGEIKVGHCPERNLSRSRNIGIALSSGDIVAFLDDDAVPEPEWLLDIMTAFARDPRTGAAGGLLYDHTGKSYQWRFGTVDRLAHANMSWSAPTPQFNFPLSFSFPSVMGANAAFRREAIVEAGGFDEEYDYYLDESDLICRVLDSGWRIAQLERAVVHHKFAASTIRTPQRVLRSHYSVLKNQLYFMLVNARRHVKISQIIAEMHKFIAKHRRDVSWQVDAGLLPPEALQHFEDEQERAWARGLERGMSGQRRLPDPSGMSGSPASFLPLGTLQRPGEQRCFVFSTAAYPPGPVGGIGRYVHHLARSIAKLGHQVHVLTKAPTHDRVDFEDGVWVHRLVVRDHRDDQPEAISGVPVHIWNYSSTLRDEVREIASRRKIDCVVTPIWDVEGIAFAGEDMVPHVVSLHTTLHSYLDSNPHKRDDVSFMRAFGQPMLHAERRLLDGSRLLLANSKAIVKEIESAYGLELSPDRYAVVPHGTEDWSQSVGEAPPALAEGCLRLVCVGRFEPRKGIDVLMKIAPALLQRYPNVWLDFVGDDKVEGPAGRSWREIYEEGWADGDWRKRVVVHGEVSESRLRGYYRAADVIIAPSRFESFGLVHLEAMMYGKPVIGCRAGGMAELIEDGRTGLLAEPGDAASLARCVERLIADGSLRERLGANARQAYLDGFTSMSMARAVVDVLTRVAGEARRAKTGRAVAVAS